MKNFLFLCCAFLMMVPSIANAKAEKPYGSAGCGLGSVIIKNEGFAQVFAATTNGTSASQTFGITSGTSNCTTNGVVKADREREAFAEASMPHLIQDMAQGNGEYLNTLGKLYGCPDEAMPALGQLTQANFEEVCREDATARTLLSSLEAKMAANQTLAGSCQLL